MVHKLTWVLAMLSPKGWVCECPLCSRPVCYDSSMQHHREIEPRAVPSSNRDCGDKYRFSQEQENSQVLRIPVGKSGNGKETGRLRTAGIPHWSTWVELRVHSCPYPAQELDRTAVVLDAFIKRTLQNIEHHAQHWAATMHLLNPHPYHRCPRSFLSSFLLAFPALSK